MQTDGEGEDTEEGSVVGAALLFAGTAVGAGMLALPALTLRPLG
jgi:amino acid permease